MSALDKRVGALEQSRSAVALPWVCLRRYEGETDEQAIAAYQDEHGSIGDRNIVMRVIISKTGQRPSAGQSTF